MTAEQWTVLLFSAGLILAAILAWKVYQIRRAYQGAIEIEGDVVSVTSYEAINYSQYGTTGTCFIQQVEFELNGKKYFQAGGVFFRVAPDAKGASYIVVQPPQ